MVGYKYSLPEAIPSPLFLNPTFEGVKYFANISRRNFQASLFEVYTLICMNLPFTFFSCSPSFRFSLVAYVPHQCHLLESLPACCGFHSSAVYKSSKNTIINISVLTFRDLWQTLDMKVKNSDTIHALMMDVRPQINVIIFAETIAVLDLLPIANHHVSWKCRSNFSL